MDTIREEYQFVDIDSAVVKFAKKMQEHGDVVESTRSNAQDTYKREIVELTHQVYSIENGQKVISGFRNFRQVPFWTISEIMTEIMNMSQPLMSKYSPEVMEWSYKLGYDKKPRYTYGSRLGEFEQVTNTFEKLKNNISSKKAVMQIYMPYDTDQKHADVPCTTQYHILCRDGKLDLTTMWRSHDLCGGLRYDLQLSSFIQQTFVSWLKAEGHDIRVGKLICFDASLHYYPQKNGEQFDKLLAEVQSYDASKNFYVDVAPSSFELSITEYYDDLRRVQKAEEAAYYGNYKYSEEQLSKIKSSVMRDYARIFQLKNLTRAKLDLEAAVVKDSIENADIKKWVIAKK